MQQGYSVALHWQDIVGLAGTLAILLAYFLLQTRRVAATGLGYQWLNLIGAACILVSLVGKFNLPVFLLELAWVLVSGYGIVRSLRERRGRSSRS